MFEPRHYALVFTEVQGRRAREQRDAEPLRSAWAALRRRRPTSTLLRAQQDALLYRLAADEDAGARALRSLPAAATEDAGVGRLAQIVALLLQAQCHELLHDHPAFERRAAWLKDYAERVRAHLRAEDGLLHVERMWLNTLRLASAIVLEDERRFAMACDLFRDCVRQDLHFDGYIRAAAQGRRGGSLGRMLLTAQALALCAEAATLAGEPLWDFAARGVSALTPAPYLLYYYWYPEKWRWDGVADDGGLPPEGDHAPPAEEARRLYRRHAGLWELAQARSPSPDRQLLLAELRPVFDEWGGGPLTLTHAIPEPAPGHARRRLFGRMRRGTRR